MATPPSPALNLVLVADETCLSSTQLRWWRTSLAQFTACIGGKPKQVDIVGVWSETLTTARKVAWELTGPEASLFYGYDTNEEGEGEGDGSPFGLKKLLRRPGGASRVDALLVDLAPQAHTHFLDQVFDLMANQDPPLAILSAFWPTTSPDVFTKLIAKYSAAIIGGKGSGDCGGLPLLWSVHNPIVHEAIMTSASDLLSDDSIGEIGGASLIGSVLPCFSIQDEQGAAADVLIRHLTTQYMQLITRLTQSDMAQLSCTTSSSKGSMQVLSGWGLLNRGAVCSFTITTSEVPQLDFSIWGSRGRLSIQWDANKSFFEVQRHRRQYEQPTYHHAVGRMWSLATFIEDAKHLVACYNGEGAYGDKLAAIMSASRVALVNCLLFTTIADAAMTSNEATIAFKPVGGPKGEKPAAAKRGSSADGEGAIATAKC